MISETVNRIVSTSKNSSGKSWDTIWIPYHDGVDGAISIPFPSNTIISKDIADEALVMTWNNGRSILYRAIFRKW